MKKGILITLLILIFSIKIYDNSASASTKQVETKQSNYIESNGFIIDGNIVLQNYAQSGNGTRDNPYVIKDLQIGSDPYSADGILIINTNKYLVMENIDFIFNGNSIINYNNANFSAGLTLVNVSNILITECSFNDNTAINRQDGLTVINGNNVNVTFTELQANSLNAFNITKGFFTNNLFIGLGLSNSSEINVLNNILSFRDENFYQAYVFSSNTKFVFQNNTVNVSVGIMIINCKDSLLKNNSLNNNAYFDLEETNYSIIANNVISNNLNVASIYMLNCYNLTLSLNTLTYNLINIQLVNSYNNSIINNIIEKEEFIKYINNTALPSIGVEVNNSNKNTISYNNISSIGIGIAIQNSNCNDILYNNIFNVSIGIQLQNSSTNYIIKNRINQAQKTTYVDISGSFNLYEPYVERTSPGWELLSALVVLICVSFWKIRDKRQYKEK